MRTERVRDAKRELLAGTPAELPLFQQWRGVALRDGVVGDSDA